ncbi:hypothetical protein D1AOALGA4SA_382 [Olavius algarvensis Delta 1 endosymbiont]|nr:hypothetical protein D1AOALGA4SA_382 [Olavius algarvensis Delta 1 endosymbiont]
MKQRRPLIVSFHNKGNGWIVLKFTFPQKAIAIHLSSVFDPIPDLFKWIEKIGFSDLPAEITIDEEGHGKILVAQALSKDATDSFLLKIFNRPENDQLLIKSELSKFDFIMAFLNSFQSMLNKEELIWSGDYNPNVLPMKAIKKLFFGNDCITTLVEQTA